MRRAGFFRWARSVGVSGGGREKLVKNPAPAQEVRYECHGGGHCALARAPCLRLRGSEFFWCFLSPRALISSGSAGVKCACRCVGCVPSGVACGGVGEDTWRANAVRDDRTPPPHPARRHGRRPVRRTRNSACSPPRPRVTARASLVQPLLPPSTAAGGGKGCRRPAARRSGRSPAALAPSSLRARGCRPPAAPAQRSAES